MIEDPPLLTIRRRFPRPPAELAARFRDVATGHLVDAMDGRGCLGHRIRPLDHANATLFGVALTCHAGPADNLAVFGALHVAMPGDVVVAAADAFTGAAVIGDLLIGMLKNKGVAGFVTDGLVRDVAGIEAAGLPVFCAGLTANSPARSGPGSVGFPVVLGGTTIAPGDIVVGDRDGIVVVPQAEIGQVLARLDLVRAAEAELEAKVRTGLQVPDFVARVLQSDRTIYLD